MFPPIDQTSLERNPFEMAGDSIDSNIFQTKLSNVKNLRNHRKSHAKYTSRYRNPSQSSRMKLDDFNERLEKLKDPFLG